MEKVVDALASDLRVNFTFKGAEDLRADAVLNKVVGSDLIWFRSRFLMYVWTHSFLGSAQTSLLSLVTKTTASLGHLLLVILL